MKTTEKTTEEEKLKTQIKLHLKLLAETNMYTKEMDVTATDLYDLFRTNTQQTSIEFAMHVSNKLNPDAKILYNYVLHLGLYNKWIKNQ